jgi:VWFA-related protein
MRHALPVVLLCLLQAQPPAPPPAVPTFRTSTRLVVQIVSVKDQHGQPIAGLTDQDFVVTEDGQPQQIAFVEFQRLLDEPLPALDVTAAPAAGLEPATPARATIAAPPAGRITYQDKRLLVLYFDLATMPPGDELRAITQARKFLDTQMTKADTMAILAFQHGAVRVRQDFTDDRLRLAAALQALIGTGDPDADAGREVADAGTDFGQNDAEFRLLSTDRQLAALQTAATMLGPLAERKTLIYFTSGLRLDGTDNQAQLRATINAAVRANVTINPIDARGLVAMAPLGDATRGSSGGASMFTGAVAQAIVANTQRAQDSLFTLAKDTGGTAMFDYNELSVGIAQAARAVNSYYIIGYHSGNTRADGRFRRVRVTLAGNRAADLAYRPGYFGDKPFAQFTAADRERQLEEALLLENPITDMTLALEVNYFQLNRAEYFVPVALKVPGHELALAQGRGAGRTRLDVIGEVKDAYGVTHRNVRDKLDIALNADTARQLAARPVYYETGFTLLPGKYVIKMLVRDATTGRIGTYQTGFAIPNLERELERLPLSSVVLSSQRVSTTEALHSVQGAADADRADPLVRDGRKLIPSVTRVFSTSRELYVFAQAYPRQPGARSLVAFVAFYRGTDKVFQTPTATISGTRTVPLTLDVSLQGLTPGRYQCQLTVLDPEGQQAVFWRAPVMLVR